MSGELIGVMAEILQHMKENNAAQSQQNALMRKHNEAQKDTNLRIKKTRDTVDAVSWRLVLVGVIVLVGAVVAGVAVVFSVQTAGRVEDARAGIRGAREELEANQKLGKEINDRAAQQILLLQELVTKIEEAPVLAVDDKGHPLLEVTITEEQARQLKKPRRHSPYGAKAIKLKKEPPPRPALSGGSAPKRKPRALVPLEMGF